MVMMVMMILAAPTGTTATTTTTASTATPHTVRGGGRWHRVANLARIAPRARPRPCMALPGGGLTVRPRAPTTTTTAAAGRTITVFRPCNALPTGGRIIACCRRVAAVCVLVSTRTTVSAALTVAAVRRLARFRQIVVTVRAVVGVQLTAIIVAGRCRRRRIRWREGGGGRGRLRRVVVCVVLHQAAAVAVLVRPAGGRGKRIVVDQRCVLALAADATKSLIGRRVPDAFRWLKVAERKSHTRFQTTYL